MDLMEGWLDAGRQLDAVFKTSSGSLVKDFGCLECDVEKEPEAVSVLGTSVDISFQFTFLSF